MSNIFTLTLTFHDIKEPMQALKDSSTWRWTINLSGIVYSKFLTKYSQSDLQYIQTSLKILSFTFIDDSKEIKHILDCSRVKMLLTRCLGLESRQFFNNNSKKKIGYILYHRKGDNVKPYVFQNLKTKKFGVNTPIAPLHFSCFCFTKENIKKAVKFDLFWKLVLKKW